MSKKDNMNQALATVINQQDTAPTHKNNKLLIKDEWLEKGKVKRPSTFTPPTGTPKSMGVANAIECTNIFFNHLNYYPTEEESWRVVRNSGTLDTKFEVEKFKTIVKVELKPWSREAHKEFHRRGFSDFHKRKL